MNNLKNNIFYHINETLKEYYWKNQFNFGHMSYTRYMDNTKLFNTLNAIQKTDVLINITKIFGISQKEILNYLDEFIKNDIWLRYE